MMKLFRNYICMAALILGACIVTACDDDDDDDTTSISASTGIAVDVAGTRYGYTTVESAYLTSTYLYIGEHIHVKYVDETTVKVVYNNDTWGDYTVDQASITTNSDGSYSLSGSGSATITIPGSTEASTYDCTMSGTVESDLTATIIFSVSVMGTTTVTVTEGTVDSATASAYLATLDYSDGTATLDNSTVSFLSGLADSGTLTIAANADGETLDVTYASDTWGTYALEGLTVSDDGNGYFVIEGSGTVDIAYGSYSFTDQAYTLEASINSDATEYTFTYTVEIDMLGTTTLVYTYLAEEDDEEEEEIDGEITDGSVLAGTYTGALEGSLAASATTLPYGPYDSQEVIITANDDGTINITYDAYDDYDSTANDGTGSGYDWGDYEMTNVDVYLLSDGSYYFVDDGSTAISYSSYAKDYDIDYTFKGSIVSESDFTFSISFNVLNMFDAAFTVTPE